MSIHLTRKPGDTNTKIVQVLTRRFRLAKYSLRSRAGQIRQDTRPNKFARKTKFLKRRQAITKRRDKNLIGKR